MTKIENMREDSGLGRLLSECFAGGERLRRELRLSAECFIICIFKSFL